MPKTMQLLQFMVPTFGIYLAFPVVALAETAAVPAPSRAGRCRARCSEQRRDVAQSVLLVWAQVGRFCPKESLAALGPGSAICNLATSPPRPPPALRSPTLPRAIPRPPSDTLPSQAPSCPPLLLFSLPLTLLYSQPSALLHAPGSGLGAAC